jgi:hypothetical protein
MRTAGNSLLLPTHTKESYFPASVTPLHELLLQAIVIAKEREPGLSDSEIAFRAGITQPTLSRAKRRCGPSTLEAVLDTLSLDLSLATHPAKTKPVRSPAAALSEAPQASAARVAHSTRAAYADASYRSPQALTKVSKRK